MRMAVLLSFFILLVFPFAVFSQEYSLRTGITDFIESKKANPESARVVSELSTHLGKYSFITLVERSKISSLMDEIALGQSGLIDEATAAKGAKIFGLQAVIDGTISRGIINARVMHAETAKIIAVASYPVSDTESCAKKLASGIETYIAREKLRFMRNDSPDINIQFSVESGGKIVADNRKSGEMRNGQTAVFKVKSDRDGFLTIVDIQPSGDIVVLFPNDFIRSNEVKAGITYSVPSPSDEFEITVSGGGTDHLVAFFTLRKVEWLNPKKLAGEGFKSVKDGEKAAAAREFSITATKIKKNEWESSTVMVEVNK